MLLRLVPLLPTALLLFGCGTPVSLDYDEKYDFSRLNSYDMLQPSKSINGDIRVDNPLLARRITNAIETRLKAQGHPKVTKTPDFLVTYHLRISKEIESRNIGVRPGTGIYNNHTAIGIGYGYPLYEIYSYERGILTIDVLNSKTKTLIWRGATSRRLFQDQSSPEDTKKLVSAVVTEILQRFPPGMQK